MPANTRSKVDLPQPDGPRINTVSPAAALSEVSASNTSPLGSEMVRGVVCKALMLVAVPVKDSGATSATSSTLMASIWS